MKWFNRLCYLVATEICMVRRKPDLELAWPKLARAGEEPPWGGEPEDHDEPICLLAQSQAEHPLGHQVLPGLPVETFPPE